MQYLCIFSQRNVMMRLGLQLTMGSFSLTLFSLIGVAFGMNLESSLEEVPSLFNNLGFAFFLKKKNITSSCILFLSPQDPRVFWLVTGFMLLGSGLLWRRLLSFLGRHLEPSMVSQNFNSPVFLMCHLCIVFF